jgi:hypothetical protein
LRRGALHDLGGDDRVVTWLRSARGAPGVAVAINTGTEAATVGLPFPSGDIVLCTDRGREGRAVTGSVELPPLGAAWVVESGG